MKSISSYEFQMMQKKLERIENTLSGKVCDEEVQNVFKLEEIRKIRKSLKKVFSEYTKQYLRLEEIIIKYNTLHNKTSNNIRINYRALNRKLSNDAEERTLLGLPAHRPTRISSPVQTIKGSRARHFQSKTNLS